MNNAVSLAIRQLAEFTCRTGSIDSRFTGLDRGLEGGRIHRRLQKENKSRLGAKHYEAEAPLSLAVSYRGVEYSLSGRADGILRKEGRVLVDEIKTTAEALEQLEMRTHPEHLAQALCYGHILCAKEGLAKVEVQLSYFNIDTGRQRSFCESFTAKQAEEAVLAMLEKYHPFAERQLGWQEQRTACLKGLEFPFGRYRDGQRSMAIGVYNACKAGEKLFCCAPTGTGKTVSTLFPAMKAMGEGHGERIFYLTAKTTSRKTAEDALAMLCQGQGFAFASITLTAKDKICFLEERACLPEACPYAKGYYDRLRAALLDMLQNQRAFSRGEVERYAKKHSLCPYELSLDMALWCDAIVCDYNYVFDPVVYLRRFFEGRGGEYLFLVDEAHNLLERGRDMYSARLNKSDFTALKKRLPPRHKQLHRALGNVNAAFLALKKQCAAQETKTLCQKALPAQMTGPVEKFVAAAAAFLEEDKGSEVEQELLSLYFAAGFYQKIEALYGKNYLTLVHSGRDVELRLVCLDPADFLRQALNKGRAAVLFSATLLPLPYYRRVLGGLGPKEAEEPPEAGEEREKQPPKERRARLLNLASPFDHERLGIYIAGGVSTKYTDRQASLPAVVDMLHAMAAAKRGNYIAYFPSYKYMEQALALFRERFPQTEAVAQQSGMTDEEREEFLDRFTAQKGETMLAFCVMGGVFSEGVDLAGDRLIGAAVVGVGLPQIGPVPDAIRDYYDEKGEDGFDYAYRYPGMNKVLQAAGRVIRTESDRGVLLLLDSRFASPGYSRLFPGHWRHAKITGTGALAAQLAEFWGRG